MTLRRLQKKPRVRVAVPIPGALRESLLGVFERIQEAKNDPGIDLDFDDAIQVGAVCGGRYGKKLRPYVLTYYPEDDRERGQWHLTLSRSDIEDIGEGRLTELLMYCCTSSDCRYKTREADEECSDCDYVDDPNFGTFPFPEAAAKLAHWGITEVTGGSTQDEAIASLGPPDATGGGLFHPPLGYIWPFIVYRRPDCFLRIEFNKECTRIRNVTIDEKDWEPGK